MAGRKVELEDLVPPMEDGDDGYWDGDDPDNPDDGPVSLPTRAGRARAGKSGPNRILALEKQRRALEMRKAGAAYAAIADALGYASPAGAHAAVKKAMEDLIMEPAHDLRSVQYERLNHMLVTLWPKINSGDERAISTGLAIMDKMDRLMGTDAPRKSEVDVNVQGAVVVADLNEQDYIAAMQAVVGRTAMHNGALALQAGDDDTIIDAEIVEADVEESEPTPDPQQRRAPRRQRKRSLSLTEAE